MPTTFTIEEAKSGRAGCKKCKEKICKGELRIGSHSEADDKTFTSWYHVECFTIPRKFKTEYTLTQFLEDLVEDKTSDGILSTDDGLSEIAGKMGTKAKTGGKKRAAADDDGPLASIKANSLALMGNDEPAKKKVKLSAQAKLEAEAYAEYSPMKIAELQDVLRWNKVQTGGKKDILLLRLIDGVTRGRLGKCPSCIQGKLRLKEDGSKIECPGFFNEDSGGYDKCFFTTDVDKVKRLDWYDHEPTEEEIEAEEVNGTKKSAGSIPEELLKNVEWDTSNVAGIKKTTAALVEVITAEDSPLAIPEDANVSKVKRAVGPIILQNKEKSKDEILQLVIDKYGLKEAKAEESKAKAEASASICTVDANGPIYNEIMELASAYSKEANFNAANTYRKVANAVKELGFEITLDNAKGLGGGKKTKVAGIGKKSAEYMHEFLKTGKIEKLEQKKASFE